ncbi:hypothetical protein FKW77_000220 [Venturia effusa]|uniref:Transcription factor domain-containing protein n=1 Tax=Venturia effusa TaxID=50376 RepID=A0A517LHV4_9PEZI|nr:hypothetical protein FKW77_000220 [Venturia effusa]
MASRMLETDHDAHAMPAARGKADAKSLTARPHVHCAGFIAKIVCSKRIHSLGKGEKLALIQASPFEQSLLSQAVFDDKDEITLGLSVLRKVNDTNSFLLIPDQTDQGGQNRREELDDLDAIETIVAPHGQALINLYMQDKWGSLVHGRPSHITHSDWGVKPIIARDFPENAGDEDNEEGSTEVEKGRILFCEMISLTEILSLILSGFYTLRAVEDYIVHTQEGGRWMLEKAKPIQIRLTDWFSQMPECLKVENLKMRKLNSAGYLHLAYYAAEITLHRQILRSLAYETDQKLIMICRSAALARLVTVTAFVRNLRPEHLQSFWYSASKYCFSVVGTFIGLMWSTASTREEADSYKEKLEEYRWTLRLSYKSADFLDRAMCMLTLSTTTLVKAITEKRSQGEDGATSLSDTEGAPVNDIEQGNDSGPEDELWNAGLDHASVDELNLPASPAQFSEDAMTMLWPGFSTVTASMQTAGHERANPMPMIVPQQCSGLMDISQGQAQLHQHNGLTVQPFMSTGGDFEAQPLQL